GHGGVGILGQRLLVRLGGLLGGRLVRGRRRRRGSSGSMPGGRRTAAPRVRGRPFDRGGPGRRGRLIGGRRCVRLGRGRSGLCLRRGGGRLGRRGGRGRGGRGRRLDRSDRGR